jgi:hypothetical protein
VIHRSTDVRAALRSRQRGFFLDPYRFGSAGPSDPDFSTTVLLLHGTGGNGSTTIIDSSGYGHSMTANNGAQTSTAQSVYGGSSILFDGVNDYVSTPNDTAFDMHAGAFTIEALVYLNSYLSGAEQTLIGKADDLLFATYEWNVLLSQNWLRFYYGERGTSQFSLRLFWPSALPLTTWSAIAVQRSVSGDWSCSLNGTPGTDYQVAPLAGSPSFGSVITGTYTDTVDLGTTTNHVTVGAVTSAPGHATEAPLAAYVQEVRYSQPIERYPGGSYTPAIAPFPNH